MTFDIDIFASQSPTTAICENAQLFGAIPEPGEHDPCEICDRDEVIDALAEALHILA